ncbi:acetyltransferase, partial [Streptomyces rimosus subsp. rimosus]
MIEIRTPRLLLRRWHDDDLAPMADIDADPRVMRWIDDGSV